MKGRHVSTRLADRVARAKEQLAFAWREDEPRSRVEEVLEELVPGVQAGSMDWVGPDLRTPDINTRIRVPWRDTAWFGERLIQQYMPFDPMNLGAGSNAAVDLRQLVERLGWWESYHVFIESCLGPLGFGSFAMVQLQHSGRALTQYFLVRSGGDASFSEPEINTFQAIVPSLQEGSACLAQLRAAGRPLGDVEAVISAVSQPALLVTPSGLVLFMNDRAAKDARSWRRLVWLALRDPHPKWVKRLPIDLDGRRLFVILAEELSGAELGIAAGVLADRHDLPPRIALIAAFALRGLADKEIAAAARLSVHSVRTYLKELYRRLRVSSRGELMSILSGTRERPR